MDDDAFTTARIAKHSLQRLKGERNAQVRTTLSDLKGQLSGLSEVLYEAGSTAVTAAAHAQAVHGTDLDQTKLWQLLGAADCLRRDVEHATVQLHALDEGCAELVRHYKALDRLQTELDRTRKQLQSADKIAGP